MNTFKSENSVRLNIADIPVALEIADADKLAEIRERYAEFIVADREPQAILRVEINPGARFIPLQSGPWIIELTNHVGRLNYRSHFDAGWMDIEAGRGFVEIAPEADIENFLRVLYAHLCLRSNGLLLHAAGIVRADTGYVFFGPSGSGKSTVARFSPGHTVLSDDLVIVKMHGDGARVYGVPFRGDFPEAPRVNVSADLSALFALVKATEHGVASLPMPEAIARLIACVPFVMTDAGRAKRVMEICRQLTRCVPIRALRFRMDSGFWRELDDC